MRTIFLGIDIAKKSFDAAFTANGVSHHRHFPNNSEGVRALAEWVAPLDARVHVALEATGSYWQNAAHELYARGWTVSVMNPLRISAYAKACAQHSKTDKLDAQLLARFAENERPPAWQPCAEEERVLQMLIKEAHYVRRQIAREKSRLEHAEALLAPMIARWQEFWRDCLQWLENLTSEHIARFPQLQKRLLLLRSVPGIGEKTAAPLLAYLGNLQRFKNAKALSSFAGLAPRLHQSGTSVRGQTRIKKDCRRELRAVLFMPALVVSFGRHRAFQPFVARLLKNGKSRKEIVIAVMRKILTVAYGVIKNNIPYDVTRHEC